MVVSQNSYNIVKSEKNSKSKFSRNVKQISEETKYCIYIYIYIYNRNNAILKLLISDKVW
jgi:hypothetical protein